MRFAGDFIEPYTGDYQMSPGGTWARDIYQYGQQNLPKFFFKPSQLDMTVPELQFAPGPFNPGQDLLRDRYILHSPASGIG